MSRDHHRLSSLFPTSVPAQEAADRLLRPSEDVRTDQRELAAGEGPLVQQRVLLLAHRQQ